MLPRARIPIIKLTLPPSSGAPFGIQCDIGFENRLALENTRLLLTYALTDTRLRTMVLFSKRLSIRTSTVLSSAFDPELLADRFPFFAPMFSHAAVKVWTKRRKINNPYVGTLSSYGYVLMVIYYLTHIVRPPVLPFVSGVFFFLPIKADANLRMRPLCAEIYNAYRLYKI